MFCRSDLWLYGLDACDSEIYCLNLETYGLNTCDLEIYAMMSVPLEVDEPEVYSL